MRRFAKASSAGSIHGAGKSRRPVRRAIATRGAGANSNGSGAPSIGLLAVLALTIAGLLSFAAPAFAANVELGSFGGGGSGPGGSGSADGQLSNAGQTAVNDASGNIYVADTGNDRVEIFKPTAAAAEYDSKVTIAAPIGVAVDQATGDVYVANASGVAKYDEDLNPILSGWTGPAATGTLAVDPSSGDLLVADQANDLIRRFESDGTAAGSFAAARPIGIAANSDGDIFVVTSTGDVTLECAPTATSSVQRFSAAGVAEGTIGASLEAPGAVAVDPDDDSIVVAAAVNQYNCEPFESPELATFAADGTAQGVVALPESTYAMVPGLALQGGGSSRVYALVRSPLNDFYVSTRVIAFGESAPKVLTISAYPLTGGNKALLGGRVNPQNQPTVYWFEYGPNTSYGTSIPASHDAAAGSGVEGVSFDRQIAGLLPETEYHYRIVAENATGVTPGRDMTFTTASAAGPPQEQCSNAGFRAQQGAQGAAECRAWEMVSPLDKNNLDAGGSEFSPSPVPASVSGNQAMLFADGGFGDSESGSTGNGYMATRGADGWTTRGLMPPVKVTTTFGNRGTFEKLISADLSKSLMGSASPLTPDSPAGVPNLYVRDNVTNQYELVTINPPIDPPEYIQAPWVAATTPDFKKVLFYSYCKYTDDAPTVTVGSPPLLYEWEAGNPELKLVGYFPEDGGAVPGVYLGGQSNNGVSGSAYNALSEDGSRIYFNGPDPVSFTAPTYLRENGETKQVSTNGQFWTATPSGSRALFLEGGVLKRYDAATETFTDISPDEEPADGSGPNVSGLVANSDDLSVVYFVARNRLVAGQEADGDESLYVSNDGVVSYIGSTGRSTDSVGAEVADENGLSFDANYPLGGNRMATPDGRLLVFASARRLTAYDNASRSEIYVYDNETGELNCASCRPDGSPPSGQAVLSGITTPHGSLLSISLNFPRHNLDADGERVFFQTTDAVSPDDTNGTNDIYVWADGHVSLVTPGVGDDREGYFFKGADPSGDNVFFATRNRLVGIDTDGLGDIYDARVNGGIAAQLALAAVAPCEGDQCRGASTAAPASTAPASREIRGAQNAAPKKKAKHHKKKHKKQKKHHKKQHKKKHKASHRAQRNG